MESINEIKKRFAETEIYDILKLAEEYKSDNRSGVRTVINTYANRYKKYIAELERLEKINEYENKYYNDGIEYIAGIDEVGRGPLAGPVVTAAVILPKGCRIKGINDSKKLSAKKREELYDVIMEKAVAVETGVVNNEVIDHINILQATYKAMAQAINGLKVKPQQILVDAVTIPGIDIPQESIIKGDEKSMSIGAASIIAKVTRDRMMVQYAKIYTEFDFENNMGYGTQKHIEGIRKYGLCPLHRRSFTKNLV